MKKLFLLFLLLFPALATASDNETVNLTFEIEPVSVVKIEADIGGRDIHLGPVIGGNPVESRIQIHVLTNTNEPYRIYQEFRSEIVNSSGAVFPESLLRMQVSNGKAGGTSEIASLTPVSRDRTPIFYSSTGNAEQFSILYQFSDEAPVEAGNYYGNVHLEIVPA